MPDLDAALSEALLAILLEEGDWHQFLRLLISDQGDASALFMLQSDSASGKSGTLSIVTGLDDKAVQDYADHFASVNPWLPDHVLHTSAPHARRDFDVIDRETLKRSEYYNDYLRPIGLEGSAGLTVSRREGEAMLLATVLGNPDPEAAAKMARRLDAIRPLLLRVMDYYKRRDEGELASSAALEVMGAGLCLFKDDGQILHLSPSAEALGEALDLFCLDPLGKLQLKPPLLQEAGQQMLSRDYSGPPQRVIRQKDCRLTLFRPSRSSMSDLLCGPTLGLIIEPMRSTLDTAQEQELIRRYGLTSAEMRALRGIAMGASIQDMAESTGRSVETLRSQVKSLLNKTGCGTQLQLVHFLRSL